MFFFFFFGGGGGGGGERKILPSCLMYMAETELKKMALHSNKEQQSYLLLSLILFEQRQCHSDPRKDTLNCNTVHKYLLASQGHPNEQKTKLHVTEIVYYDSFRFLIQL